MTRCMSAICVFVLSVSAVLADTITTVNGDTYSNAKVTRQEPTGITISHPKGITRIPYSDLSDADKVKYGYDAAKEKEFYENQAKALKDKQDKAAQQKALSEERRERAKLEQEKRRNAEIRKAQQEEAERQRVLNPPADQMTPIEFRTQLPKHRVAFKCYAKLSDYYNFEWSDIVDDKVRKVFWSVSLETLKREDLGQGYIRSETAQGKSLYDLLKDGKEHPIKAIVHYNARPEHSSAFNLDGWEPLPKEESPNRDGVQE